MKRAVWIFLFTAFVCGCGATPRTVPGPEFGRPVSNKLKVENKKPSPMREEVSVRKELRPRTGKEKAGVVLKETGEEMVKGAMVGGVTGSLVGQITGKEVEAPVIGGAVGATIGAGKGISEGFKKARQPVKEKVTRVRVFPGFEGVKAVFPRRNEPYVMRTWIAPWRDEKDRLRWSRYVFTDLSINRWNLGEKPEVISKKELLKLLSTESHGRIFQKIYRKIK